MHRSGCRPRTFHLSPRNSIPHGREIGRCRTSCTALCRRCTPVPLGSSQHFGSRRCSPVFWRGMRERPNMNRTSFGRERRRPADHRANTFRSSSSHLGKRASRRTRGRKCRFCRQIPRGNPCSSCIRTKRLRDIPERPGRWCSSRTPVRLGHTRCWRSPRRTSCRRSTPCRRCPNRGPAAARLRRPEAACPTHRERARRCPMRSRSSCWNPRCVLVRSLPILARRRPSRRRTHRPVHQATRLCR